jgi:hypothetical protein
MHTPSVHCTGGDFSTFVVNIPATLAAVSLTISAQSGFVTEAFLIFAQTPEAR